MSSIDIQLSSHLDATGFKQLDSAVSKARSSLGSIGKNSLGGLNSSIGDASKSVANLKQGLSGLGQALGVSSYVGQWTGLGTAIFSAASAYRSFVKDGQGLSKILNTGSLPLGRSKATASRMSALDSFTATEKIALLENRAFSRNYNSNRGYNSRAYMQTNMVNSTSYDRGVSSSNVGGQSLIGLGGAVAAVAAVAFAFKGLSALSSDGISAVPKKIENAMGEASGYIVDFFTNFKEAAAEAGKIIQGNLAQTGMTGISEEGTIRHSQMLRSLIISSKDEETKNALRKQLDDLRSGKLAETFYGSSFKSIKQSEEKKALESKGVDMANAQDGETQYVSLLTQISDLNAEITDKVQKNSVIEVLALNKKRESLEVIQKAYETQVNDFKEQADNYEKIGQNVTSILSDFFGDIDKEAQKINELLSEGRVNNLLTDFFGSMDEISSKRGIKTSVSSIPSDSLTNVGNFGFSGGAIYTSTFGAMNNALQQQVAITRQIEQNTRKENNAPAYKTTVTAQSGGFNAGGFGIVTQF